MHLLQPSNESITKHLHEFESHIAGQGHSFRLVSTFSYIQLNTCKHVQACDRDVIQEA